MVDSKFVEHMGREMKQGRALIAAYGDTSRVEQLLAIVLQKLERPQDDYARAELTYLVWQARQMLTCGNLFN